MKKLTQTLLLAASVALAPTLSSAGEFKVTGQFANSFTFGTAGSAIAPIYEDSTFRAINRVQFLLNYIADENLSATMLIRMSSNPFGNLYGNGEFDSSYASAGYIRLAYMDWTVPSTDIKVRMGYQPSSLPGFAFPNPVRNGRASGISVSLPITDSIQFNTFWTRPRSADTSSGVSNEEDADLFAAALDFRFDGFRVAPWVLYGNFGTGITQTSISSGVNPFADFYSTHTGYAGDVWWGGAAFELTMFDPFKFAFDALYNIATFKKDGAETIDQKGYYLASEISYKTNNGTPKLRAWYMSGIDESDPSDKRSGVISFSSSNATTIMFDNYIVLDGFVERANGASPRGTWGVVLEWADFSFIEKLSHTARIAYVGGTNKLADTTATSISLLDEDDRAIEIDFNTTYKIYKNLSLVWQLGYVNLDLKYNGYQNGEDDSAFRSAFLFVYNF